MAEITYLNQDSYFMDKDGGINFFRKGTESTFYENMKLLTKDSPEMVKMNFESNFGEDKAKAYQNKTKALKAHYTFKGRPIQADSKSLNALIAAKESGNDPIKWYDAHNQPIMLTHNEICELITKISTRNGRIIKENQLAKEELNKCENMQQLKEWEAKYGIE